MLQQIQTKLHVIRYWGQLACFILQFLTRRKKQWCNMLFERVPRRASLLCRKNIGLLKLHLGEPQDFWNNRFWSHLVNMYCVMFGKDQKQHFGRITTANQQASTVMMMRWRQPQKLCIFQSLSRPWKCTKCALKIKAIYSTIQYISAEKQMCNGKNIYI